ncbi:MAG: helix-turn-helix transcriptional regulator [Deltaproteobacteria bacterium]|nr:helix-turn-helix transcriptional regulator [Deltaproteobacteria bacterium]
MLELTKKPNTGKFTDICLRVPAKDAAKVINATREFLKLAGHEVLEIYEEKLYLADEVFPGSHPGKILRGLRTRENLTQAQLAQKSGLKPHHISEMEHGKRSIGKDVAGRLAKTLNASYKIFL